MNSLPNPREFKDFTTILRPIQYGTKESESIPFDQVAKEFNAFEPISEHCTKYLLELFPEWMYDNAHPDDLEYFNYLMRFDVSNNSLLAAVVINEDFGTSIVSYKHRFKTGVKWRTRAGTHPNNTVMTRVFSDEDATIIVEGIRDFLAGILLGFNVIGIPTASYKGSVHIRKNDEVIFIIEDKPAYDVMTRIGTELSVLTEKIFYKVSVEHKEDLSDICLRCHTRQEVKNEIIRQRT